MLTRVWFMICATVFIVVCFVLDFLSDGTKQAKEWDTTSTFMLILYAMGMAICLVASLAEDDMLEGAEDPERKP